MNTVKFKKIAIKIRYKMPIAILKSTYDVWVFDSNNKPPSQNKNIAIYRDKIYEKVWQEEFTGKTRTLDLHIQRLRKKLNLENNIKTVFRIGYKFEV